MTDIKQGCCHGYTYSPWYWCISLVLISFCNTCEEMYYICLGYLNDATRNGEFPEENGKEYVENHSALLFIDRCFLLLVLYFTFTYVVLLNVYFECMYDVYMHFKNRK